MQGTYLVHHGIKGQKWGVRRYQNEDGSLTKAGLERYGGKKEYKNSVGRKLLTGRIGNFTGGRSLGEWQADSLSRRKEKADTKAAMARANGKEAKAIKLENKSSRLDRRLKAQQAANDDREAYDRHTSTGKMLAQNLLMSGWGAEIYRNTRARGGSRGEAFVATIFGDYTGSKKTYGESTL